MSVTVLSPEQLARLKNGETISKILGMQPRRRPPGAWSQGVRVSNRRIHGSTLHIPEQQRRPLPCIHLGNIVQRCWQGNPLRHVHECDFFDDQCTRSKMAIRSCEDCHEYDNGTTVNFPIRWDEHSLCPGIQGRRFNPSIIEDEDGFVFVFRTGWEGSELFAVRLDKDFTPFGPTVHLPLRHHPATSYGAEDPRLFQFRGQIHLMWTGVQGTRYGNSRSQRRNITTNVLYARLNPDLTVAQIFYPQIPGRQSWEKNIVMAEHDGELYGVYSIAPHRIGKIDGERWTWAFETPFKGQWHGGIMRGGCSPVRVGDEFWHFFHDRLETHPKRVYRMGAYAFSAFPPFAPCRWIPEPIISADTTGENDNYCYCFFPGGAVLKAGRWVISAGIHDRYSEIHAFEHADLESRMRTF